MSELVIILVIWRACEASTLTSVTYNCHFVCISRFHNYCATRIAHARAYFISFPSPYPWQIIHTSLPYTSSASEKRTRTRWNRLPNPSQRFTLDAPPYSLLLTLTPVRRLRMCAWGFVTSCLILTFHPLKKDLSNNIQTRGRRKRRNLKANAGTAFAFCPSTSFIYMR